MIEDEKMQHDYVKFLLGMFQESACEDFFYANDLSVLIDIVLRQITRVQDERLGLDYMQLIPYIIKNLSGTPTEHTFQDRVKARKTLQKIQESEWSKTSSKVLAKKILDTLNE